MKYCGVGVSIHTIEEQLIQNLPPVFDSEVLQKLADSQVADMAAEKQSSATDRAHNEEKLTNLVKESQELQGLDRRLLQNHGKTFGAFASEPQDAGSHTDGHIDHVPPSVSGGLSTGIDAVASLPSSAVEASVDTDYPAQAMRKKLKKGRQSGGAYSYD
ncbi:hypothetical protein LTR22_026817 [Elasticomyces elasticus]|nr:hypothetical protein LTR22_026817 [Elasticomyces elasticus]